ncbi:hypothetical protein F4804DRAFT_256360 [Jackrogersella minutella]|nr:hypothetical protein F4804DRAFT_256360 [Jackrogersella minutella]
MQQRFVDNVVEMWLLFFFGTLFIAARVYCRTKQVGIRGYRLDDYLVIAVACMWCAAPAIGHVFVAVCEGRHTSQLSHEDRKNMPPEKYHEWEYGSQMFLFGLSGYFLIVWTLKFNMLCFYQRVVRGLWVEKFVKPVMALVLISAVIIILTISLYCRPFHALWQVWPDPGPTCVPQNEVFFIVVLTFNLLTDTCIMLIPAPVIIGIRTNKFQKFGLILIFSLGFFCMFAAILRYVLVFRLKDAGISAMWSMREDFVGIVVGQLPLITPMFKRKFWVDAGYASDKTRNTYDRYNSSRSPGHELGSRLQIQSGRRKTQDPYSLTRIGVTRMGSESEEDIVRADYDKAGIINPYSPTKRNTGIMVERTIDIQRSSDRSIDNMNDARKKGWFSIV